jgi:hypothetical protein
MNEEISSLCNKKYKIGQTYLLKVFLEPEEMEYLGEVKTRQYNGSCVTIKFDVFRRYSYGRPDLIALYDGEFFTRSYNNSVEDLTKEVGNAFRFKGKGYSHISVGNISLSISEFLEQTNGLLKEIQIEETILNGRYVSCQNHNGEIKWCPQCDKIRQTSCSACGCGNCQNCGYRWCCRPIDLTIGGVTYPFNVSSVSFTRTDIDKFENMPDYNI